MRGFVGWLTDFTEWARAAGGVLVSATVFWALGTPMTGKTCLVAAGLYVIILIAAVVQACARSAASELDSEDASTP